MYRATRRTVTLSLLAALAACGSSKSRFKTYNGPPVTQVVVNKGQRRMYLLHNQTVLKSYDIGLGNEPIGHKQFEGDGKTPEGVYFVDRFNPRSQFHLSVGVSYPNERDTAYAEQFNLSPGGDIFIHGRGPEGNAKAPKKRDWTAGCIAVKDEEIEDIYAMMRGGVPVVINP
ncbi:L,D-transpeptidase family protein [Paracoccus sp. Z330]|uniref:L,D-transpeptidase family protein n=1 Tax=Paracoccus onchidii TaxID=3017813 RepID=A0ABT4ZDK8_9RHOB|nr:L,D-transpeptidase family protein [Paracoccus onchidii]MDB6176806.1 L,D-transpeptidase family protein [Paracoccus onchidii]